MSGFRPDLLIKDSNGRLIAVVEVQSRLNMSNDVATEIRRSILNRGLPSNMTYFLLLSQDKGFLWINAQSNSFDSAPDYEFAMNSVINRYSKRDPDHRSAQTYQKSLYLSPQDSIIYATMITDLKKRPAKEQKCFLSRDKKAFDNDDDRDIKAELEMYNCRYIGNLAQGMSHR